MSVQFEYCYGDQAEQFAFYRIPKLLITSPEFKRVSDSAKLLYGLMLDRMSLSIKNGWVDDENRAFIYFTTNDVMEQMCCGTEKATKLLAELDVEKGIGLIERKKQGLGKPTIIYVKDFTRFRKAELLDSEKQNSVILHTGTLDNRKSETNKTEKNNTESNKTNPILSGADKDMDERASYRTYLNSQLDMDILYERYPYDRETLDAIMNLMLDVICSKRKTIRIAGDDKPVNVVKAQFLKINSMHLEYVMDCMKKNPAKVRNIKQYLLAAIYNAPLTMQSYYQAWVNNDMAEGRI